MRVRRLCERHPIYLARRQLALAVVYEDGNVAAAGSWFFESEEFAVAGARPPTARSPHRSHGNFDVPAKSEKLRW